VCLEFFLKAMGSHIQCDRVFACSVEFNACHDKSIRSVFDLFCVYIDDELEVRV